MSARIELGGLALKWSQSCWMLGEPKRRIIEGKPTENLLRPSYSDDLAAAVQLLLGKASVRREQGAWEPSDEELYRLLLRAPGEACRAVLSEPGRYIEMLRDGRTDYAFAKAAGVHQTQLSRMLEPGADMLVSTLLQVLDNLEADDE